MQSSKITKLILTVVVLMLSSGVCPNFASAQTLLSTDCSNAAAVGTTPESYQSVLASTSPHISATLKIDAGASQAVVSDGGFTYLTTQQAGAVNYPYIKFVVTQPATIDSISFRHYNTNGYDPLYQLAIRADDDEYNYYGSHEMTADTSGELVNVTLNLEFDPGVHVLKFITYDFAGDDTSGDSIGIGDIKIIGTAPEPASIAILAAAGIAIITRRKRRNSGDRSQESE